MVAVVPETTGVAEPELVSLFPLGARRGSTVEVEIRGKALDGAYAAWWSTQDVQCRLVAIEEVQETDEKKKTEKKQPEFRVVLSVAIDAAAASGPHALRLVSPRGVSNELLFVVVADSLITESAHPHSTPVEAERVNFPVIVSGKIGAQAEVDYYELDVPEDQELAFEVVSSNAAIAKGFHPQISLYEPGGSWLNPTYARRLATQTEFTSQVVPLNRGVTQRCKKGRYVVEVRSLSYNGAPEFAYMLRIGPPGPLSFSRLGSGTARPSYSWRERSFDRELGQNRLERLRQRAIALERKRTASDSAPATSGSGYERDSASDLPPVSVPVTVFAEREPNDSANEAAEIAVPTLIQGAIGRPGDVDCFRFKAAAGQRLAFEVETPELGPPHFNLRIDVKDPAGREIVTNVHKKASLRNSQTSLKGMEAKITDTLEQTAVYALEVRDVTSRYGGDKHRYKVLVRPQIPHVGEIQVRGGEHVNLRPGETRKLRVSIHIEEIEFTVEPDTGRSFQGGDTVILVQGLPSGVTALPGAEVEDNPTPRDETVKKYSFLPDVQKIMILLRAEPDAPLTRMPQILRLVVQPLIQGKPGPAITAAEVPLMVVDPPNPTISAVSPKE